MVATQLLDGGRGEMTDPRHVDVVYRLRQPIAHTTSELVGVAHLHAEAADRIVVLEGALGHAEREYEKAHGDMVAWAKAAEKMSRQCDDMAVMIRRLVRRDQTLGKAAMEMLERFDRRGESMRRNKR